MRPDQSPKGDRSYVLWLTTLSLLLASPTLYGKEVQLTTTVEGDLQPTIRGTCNLPKGMKLVVHVTRKERAFQLESPVEVQDGQFAVGPLLQVGGNLNAGRYYLEVISVHPNDQSDAVKAAIGQKGQELKGP